MLFVFFDTKETPYQMRIRVLRSAVCFSDLLVGAAADGSGARRIAPVDDTNHPLPRMGERFAWSPDGTHIAFVSATPSTEPEMEADPIVITRYWYRPARGFPDRFTEIGRASCRDRVWQDV